MKCNMIINAGEEFERECGGVAVCEVETNPTCDKCKEGCSDEGLEVLPLGTHRLYSLGKAAYDHFTQFSHISAADGMLKSIAAMIALNKGTQ